MRFLNSYASTTSHQPKHSFTSIFSLGFSLRSALSSFTTSACAQRSHATTESCLLRGPTMPARSLKLRALQRLVLPRVSMARKSGAPQYPVFSTRLLGYVTILSRNCAVILAATLPGLGYYGDAAPPLLSCLTRRAFVRPADFNGALFPYPKTQLLRTRSFPRDCRRPGCQHACTCRPAIDKHFFRAPRCASRRSRIHRRPHAPGLSSLRSIGIIQSRPAFDPFNRHTQRDECACARAAYRHPASRHDRRGTQRNFQERIA